MSTFPVKPPLDTAVVNTGVSVTPGTLVYGPEFYEVGPARFGALGDRVVIREDEFRSGYECARCKGTGAISKQVYRETPQDVPAGTWEVQAVACPDCDGKGGILVVPEIVQRRPTTGVIVSAGPDCKFLHSGQAVVYSNFAGFAIDLDRAGEKVVLRILHESEILCLIEGHLDLRTVSSKAEAIGR